MDYPGHNYNPNNYDHNYDQPLNYNETSTIGNEVVTLFQVFLGLLSFSGCVHIFYGNCQYCFHEYSKKKKIKNKKIKDEELLLNECSICLENYQINDKVSHLPCGHFYHERCLTEWFKKKEECPLCRLII